MLTRGIEEGPPGLGKRPRDPNDTPDQDEEIPVPTEMAEAAPETPPRRELTLQISWTPMTRGFSTYNQNLDDMKKDLGEVKRETRAVKELSAKATTAHETKESLSSLEKRVEALETGEGPSASNTRPNVPRPTSQTRPPKGILTTLGVTRETP